MTDGLASRKFTKVYRILKTDEFSSVFSFRKPQFSEYFQLFSKPGSGDSARLGLVVAKKVAKRAVARNYMKRSIREQFRLCRADLPPLDFVVRVRRSFGRQQSAAARQQLASLFARVGACPAYSSP